MKGMSLPRALAILLGVATLAAVLSATAVARKGRATDDVTVTGIVASSSGTSVTVRTRSGKKLKCRTSSRKRSRHHRGEKVSMTCRRGQHGRVLVAISPVQPSSSSPAPRPEASEVEVEGVVRAVDTGTRTVTANAGAGPDVSCTAPEGTDLSGIAPDSWVRMRCEASPDGSLSMLRLRTEEADDEGKLEAEGPFSSGESTISVQVTSSLAATCEVPSALAAAVADLAPDARVEIECDARNGTLRLEEVEIDSGDADENEVEAKGPLTIAEGTPATVTVGTTTCEIGDPALVAGFTAGQVVEITCIDGKLTRIHTED